MGIKQSTNLATSEPQPRVSVLPEPQSVGHAEQAEEPGSGIHASPLRRSLRSSDPTLAGMGASRAQDSTVQGLPIDRPVVRAMRPEEVDWGNGQALHGPDSDPSLNPCGPRHERSALPPRIPEARKRPGLRMTRSN